MTFNAELADEIIGILTGTPERHDQGMWYSGQHLARPSRARHACGTTACVAGWAALLTLDDQQQLMAHGIEHPDGTYTHYRDYSRDALGLTGLQAAWLFYGGRTREELVWALKWLRDHEDASKAELDGACREACDDSCWAGE